MPTAGVVTAVENAVRRQFARKQKAADLNWLAVKAGYDFAAKSLTKQDPLALEAMHATEGKIIIDGNAAAALGAMFAGVTVVTAEGVGYDEPLPPNPQSATNRVVIVTAFPKT